MDLRVSGKKTQVREFIHSGILEWAQLRVCNTGFWNDLNIYPYPLSRIGHLLVGLWHILLFRLGLFHHSELPHEPEQALQVPGITPLTKPLPEFRQSQVAAAVRAVRAAAIQFPYPPLPTAM